MEQNQNPIARWLDTATAGIRFQPDRKAVKEELAAHLEDKTADFQCIFPNMTREEAEDRALDQMGGEDSLGNRYISMERRMDRTEHLTDEEWRYRMGSIWYQPLNRRARWSVCC